MPPRRPKKAPRDYVDGWPDGSVHPDAPPEVYLVRDTTKRLAEAMRKRNMSISATAKGARMTRQTIHNLRDGKVWPELSTIVWLERALGRKIWGNAHKRSPEPKEPREPEEPPA